VQNFSKILLLILLGVGLFGGCPESCPAAANPGKGIIRVRRANVRKTADKHSPRLFTLRRNDIVKILKEKPDWFYIASTEGQQGWIYKSLVKIVKPTKVKPKIRILSDELSGYQKIFFDSLVVRLQSRLADIKPQEFEFLISRIGSDEKASGSPAKKSVARQKPGSWLLILRSHFCRKDYQAESAPEIEPGTVDLLIYQHRLKVMLETRDLLRSEIRKYPALWSDDESTSPEVEILLVLKSESGDQVALSGFWEAGFPVFNDFMILEIHGFSPFSIKATLPANVSEFNQFDLPAPYLANGNRSTAALAHDFFGFPY
jgi:hypothetical protein